MSGWKTLLVRVDTRVLESLGELAALLDTVGEKHWSSWASTTADRVAAGADPSVVRRAYGGMGGLNDLINHPVNRLGRRLPVSGVLRGGGRRG